MDRTKDMPEVTQADITAAEAWKTLWGTFAERLPVEDFAYVLAAHRTKATRPLTAEIADLRAQLDEAMEALRKAIPYVEGMQMEGDMEAFDDLHHLRAILAKRKQP